MATSRWLARTSVVIPELDAVARHVVGKPTTVYDRAHHAVLSGINWDPEDLRIATSPELQRAYPRSFPSGTAKQYLTVFIARELLGVAVDEGTHCVVPYNQIRADVRSANLLIAPGFGKNYKAPKTLAPPTDVQLPAGMRYLPRGVTMCVDRNQIPFTVRLVPTAKAKVNATASTASAVFATSVVPILEREWAVACQNFRFVSDMGDAVLTDWRTGYDLYARLIDEYEAAAAAYAPA